MFFGDPVAAFANVGRALRPAGRLVMMVPQAHERNEWQRRYPPRPAGPGDRQPPVPRDPIRRPPPIRLP